MNMKETRRKLLKIAAFRELGNSCSCGTSHDLRIRFLDPLNPLKEKYRHYPETLHLKILQDPRIREQIALKCPRCRYKPGRSNAV